MQIYRVKTGSNGPNFLSEDGSLRIMYPKSAENGDCEFDEITGHCVYNAPQTFGSEITDITREFLNFILLWENTDREHELLSILRNPDRLLREAEQDKLLSAYIRRNDLNQ